MEKDGLYPLVEAYWYVDTLFADDKKGKRIRVFPAIEVERAVRGFLKEVHSISKSGCVRLTDVERLARKWFSDVLQDE